MKVLFAVSNESISEAVVKKYQKDYKEIISYKNVYYFNAILKEIQRDKSYDRIIISEDLEPFANNDYEAIDRFIFEKLDSISDEASDMEGNDTPIILICSDRRAKSEQLLVKLFGIGIYSALLGQDRSIDEVCKLIRKPRTKKEAKIYYKIESEDVNYQTENEDSVSEIELQNIRAHYKKLGKNEEAYVESFNNIASQYSDAQLKIIVKFLPLNVRAVLETQSPKYQSIMAFSGKEAKVIGKKQEEKKKDSIKMDFIENQLNKQKLTRPVIVPSAVDAKNVKKLNKSTLKPSQQVLNEVEQNTVKENSEEKIIEEVPTTPKRGRGRPRKVVSEQEVSTTPKRGRGRPRKVATPPQEDINLFDLVQEEPIKDTILPGLEEEQTPRTLNKNSFEEETINNYRTYKNLQEDNYYPNIIDKEEDNTEILNTENETYQEINIENLLTKDKKIVSFVGTTKNGTSFLINNLAEMFSKMGINTAILDATKNKNSYFIYTKNEENLRNVAVNCMENLSKGLPEGIKVNNNLTVYTTLPAKNEISDYGAILSNLVKNYSLVLIDCDFNSPFEYFKNSQEIYLVQSMDILTIQPLTAFLRDLKSKNILTQEKIRIVINKQSKIRTLNPKILIGGMSFYNDPSMSFMTELFNKDNVKYCTIPFNEQVYSKYLEGLVNCKVSVNGYPKNFINPMKDLANMVYPLLNNKHKPLNNYKK